MITYKELNKDLALSIAKGNEEVSCENDILLAWKYIADNSLATTIRMKRDLFAILPIINANGLCKI